MNNIIEAALREFAMKWANYYADQYGNEIFSVSSAMESDLTALTSKLFVPKEDHDLILAENRQLKEKFDELSEDYVRLMDQLDDDDDFGIFL